MPEIMKSEMFLQLQLCTYQPQVLSGLGICKWMPSTSFTDLKQRVIRGRRGNHQEIFKCSYRHSRLSPKYGMAIVAILCLCCKVFK